MTLNQAKGTAQALMQKKLEEKLEPTHLEVVNESPNHFSGQDESHFKLCIVSKKFENEPLVMRHRIVHEILGDLVHQIHAIGLHTYTPSEWASKKKAPESPQCSGG